MKIKLTNYEVEIKDSLSWGDIEEIKAIMINGAKMDNTGVTGYDGLAMFTTKLKAIEKAIISIKEGDKEIKFTNEWAKDLPQEDGEKLYDAVEKISKKK